MAMVAFKTKDGLIGIDDCSGLPGTVHRIIRLCRSKLPLEEQPLAPREWRDKRHYVRTYQTYKGFPLFEEV